MLHSHGTKAKFSALLVVARGIRERRDASCCYGREQRHAPWCFDCLDISGHLHRAAVRRPRRQQQQLRTGAANLRKLCYNVNSLMLIIVMYCCASCGGTFQSLCVKYGLLTFVFGSDSIGKRPLFMASIPHRHRRRPVRWHSHAQHQRRARDPSDPGRVNFPRGEYRRKGAACLQLPNKARST